MEQTQISNDWRSDISEPKATLKIADGDTATFSFSDEGMKKSHIEFGNSVVFKIVVDGETDEKLWYVNANNYDLLSQLKGLGTLTGTKIKVTRTGEKKSDTRYKIEKL